MTPEAGEYLNYDIALYLPENDPIIKVQDLQVVGAPLGAPNFKVLLGMDILKLCRINCSFGEGYFDIEPLA